MLKVAVLALFVVSCSCVDVIEVTGQKVANRNVPLKSSVVSNVGSVAVPAVGRSVVSSSPVVSSYGVSPYISSYGGFNGLHHNLGYLSDLRQRIFGTPYFGSSIYGLGSSVGVLPSVYGQYGNYLSGLYAQPAISIARPAISIAQPAVAIAQPASLAVHTGSIAVPRPQILAAGAVQQQVHPVNAAIHQLGRTVEYRPVPFQDQPIVPQEVVVEPSDQPINIHFRSRSSTVRITADHIPGEPGEVVQTQSQDEPSRITHEVVKPVIQEVKEVIQPYRQVVQEINPVVENVHTVVTHGEGQRAQYVAEPIVKQQLGLLSVRPQVQAIGIQQVVPAVQALRVQQPHYVAVARPAVGIGAVQTVVPQVQTLSVPSSVAVAQPVVSGAIVQPSHLAVHTGTIAVPRPQIAYARSVGIAQPVVGANRIVHVNQPGAVIREEVRRF